MITDALHTFSNAQAVTVTALGTDVLDLGVARDLGPGTPLRVAFGVAAAVTAAGAATVTFEIVTGVDAAITTPTVIGSSGPIGKADLTLGRPPIVVIVPPAVVSQLGQRYFGVRYTVGTGPLTAGAFNADGVVDANEGAAKFYPSGFTIV